MSDWSALRSWLRLGGARGAETRARRASPRPTFRPVLEELEDRNAPGSLAALPSDPSPGLPAPSWSSGDLTATETRTTADSALAGLDAVPAATKAASGDAPAAVQSAPPPIAVTGGASASTASSADFIPDPFAPPSTETLAQSGAFSTHDASAPPGAAGPDAAVFSPGVKVLQASPTNLLYIPHYDASSSVSQSASASGAGSSVSAIALSNASWSLIGPAPISNGQVPGTNPVSGRVTGLAADPTNPNIIYLAAAGGGVWKTTDGGASWTAETDSQATLFMGAIAVSASNPNVLYAGTGEANNSVDSYYGLGVLKSTDAGATWTLETNAGAFNRKTISKVVIDPTNPNNVFVAVAGGGVNGVGGNTGVWKSIDGGVTWTNTTTKIPGVNGNSEFSDLVINPNNPNNLFCAIGAPSGAAENGVYVTNNGGTTWAAAGNFKGGVADGNIKIDISKSNPKVVYATVADPATQGINFVAVTADGGATWVNTAAPPNYLGTQGFYDSTVAVSPTNPNIVFVGGQESNPNTGATQVLETTDGGKTWNDISVGVSGVDGPHTDHHAMTFDASGNLLDGNDGGVWRLQNAAPAAIVWQDINGNLSTLQAEGIALHPTDPNTAYLGTQDNGTSQFAGSLPWTLSDPEGGDGGFVRVDPNNPLTVYHSFAGDDANGGFFMRRSDDGGATWMDINTGLNPAGTDASDFYVPYQIDQSNPSRLILGTDHLYETTNKGANWNIISSPGAAGFNIQGAFGGAPTIDAIGLSQSAPNTIYVADGTGNIFVTTNDGAAWTQMNIPAVKDHINELVVDPTNSLSVYAVRDQFGPGKVYHSIDGGTTWTDVSGNLPDLPTYALALDTTNNILYVGNDNGVFASKDGGATWSVFGTGLPNAQVRELIFNPTLGILAAGTHGRSVWEISTATNVTPPPPTPTPTPIVTNPEAEVNQTSDTALNLGALAVGTPTSLTNLSIAPLPLGQNDYDWFAWTAGQAATFTATETTTAGGNLELHLFTLQGNTLVQLANSTVIGVRTQALSTVVAAGQEILVEVKGQNQAFGVMSQANYQLTASLT